MRIQASVSSTPARLVCSQHTPTAPPPRDHVERSETSPSNCDRIALHAGLVSGLGTFVGMGAFVGLGTFAGLARGVGAGMAGAALGMPGGILLGGLLGATAGRRLFGTSGADGTAILGAVAGGILGGAGCFLLASSVSSPILAVGLAAAGAAEGLLLESQRHVAEDGLRGQAGHPESPWASIREGMTSAQVLDLLGEPERKEPVGLLGLTKTRWLYGIYSVDIWNDDLRVSDVDGPARGSGARR